MARQQMFTGMQVPMNGVNPILRQGLNFGMNGMHIRPSAQAQSAPVQQQPQFLRTAQEPVNLGFSGIQEPVQQQVAQPVKQAPQESSYLNTLAQRESGGDYGAVNTLGYAGKYQFGKSALQDTGYKDKYGNWTGKDGIKSQDDWLKNPVVQEQAQLGLMEKQRGYLKSKGAMDFVGKTVDGIPITEQGLLAASHLLGAGGVNKWLNNPKGKAEDAYGTNIREYLQLGKG